MTPEQFSYWLQGIADAVPYITQAQWLEIKTKLATVGTPTSFYVTPKISPLMAERHPITPSYVTCYD